MKSIILGSFLLAATFIGFSSCSKDKDKETVIEYNALPQAAKDFITLHFSGATASRVEKNAVADSDGTIYEVDLSNGFEVDFDKDGNWTDVDGNNQAVPTAIIPAAITTYVTANYANRVIDGIEKKNYGFQIDLVNDVDLMFNAAGEFIGIDR